MKPELIAEWRQRMKDKTLITLPVTAIERILEERERLLDVCRTTLFCLGEEGYAGTYVPEQLHKAVAYAESE